MSADPGDMELARSYSNGVFYVKADDSWATLQRGSDFHGSKDIFKPGQFTSVKVHYQWFHGNISLVSIQSDEKTERLAVSQSNHSDCYYSGKSW